MPPFDNTFEPLALRGEAVASVNTGETYKVTGVEQMAKIGPVDYGPAPAHGEATEGNSNIIDLEDELEMDSDTLGQFWINPLSDVEIEIRQTGQQQQRFVNANRTGVITPGTPTAQRQVFVYEDETPHAIIQNPHDHDMDRTLVYYTGYKMTLDGASRRDVSEMGGEPAAVPTGSMKQRGGL